MLKKRLLFLLLVCGLLSSIAYAETHTVTLNEALAIAQRQFPDRDVDYYYLNNNPVEYVIFVDAQPMMGWEHECYTLTIPKTITTDVDSAVPSSITPGTTPPTMVFQPLLVKNRYGYNSSDKPVVRKYRVTGDDKAAAERTYALIISGGISPLSNHERYWNDCSFIYQTLVNTYGVPKENISPIMADGNNPGKDMLSITGEYVSQPLDLDNDGEDDIKLAATYDNIRRTLLALQYKLNKDDHLFIYVIDHGGKAEKDGDSYICLWGGERLTDRDLATMLTPFSDKFVNVNVVLGQCFSGGFIDNLTKVGCVVATASSASEYSWACFDKPYDEFVYHWTCAVNGADHKKKGLNADKDRNSYITMEEAFEYAKEKDRANEHPQYVSTPKSVGEDLAFDKLAPSVDIYIKDNPEDTGKEPNRTTTDNWKSPSICVRNAADGIFEHENPVYSNDHQMAFVYVRIHNRGKEDYTGGKFLHVYWAQASAGLTQKVWKGRELYSDPNTSKQYVTGDHLEAQYIDTILAGDSTVLKVRWSLPNSLEDFPEGNFHYCLLAKIMDTPYDDGYVEGQRYFNVLGSNDQAQKNITIIRRKDVKKGFNVYIRNLYSTQKTYTLELIPQTEADVALYSSAKVEMTMSPKVYSAWERGGFLYEDLELPSNSSNGVDSRKVNFISPQSKVKDITLQGDEFDVVTLKFNFDSFSSVSNTYSFDLVQKDENGNIVGGETFVVESPIMSIIPITIESQPGAPGYVQLNAVSPDFKYYNWKDDNGNELGEGNAITVSPTAPNTKYTVTAMNDEGEVAEESILLDAVQGIMCVSSESDFINISLRAVAPDNSHILLSSLENGTVIASTPISSGESEIAIDIQNCNSGVYIVTYLIDDIVVDSRKVTIAK